MVVVFAVARLYPAEVIVHYHCLNDRVVKNPPPVGASIARPLLAGGAIRISASNSRFTGARPVAMAIISFALAFFFPVVAAFYINAFAPARPVAVAIISFALAFFFTSLQIPTGGRAMLAPTTCIFCGFVI